MNAGETAWASLGPASQPTLRDISVQAVAANRKASAVRWQLRVNNEPIAALRVVFRKFPSPTSEPMAPCCSRVDPAKCSAVFESSVYLPGQLPGRLVLHAVFGGLQGGELPTSVESTIRGETQKR
jgi:hypothetical protein